MDHVDAETRSRMMAAVQSKHTGPEMAVRSLAHRLGYRFRVHRKDLPGTPDLVFPSRKSAMFVHGCFWHGHDCPRGALPTSNVNFWQEKIEKNRLRDDRSEARLRENGWNVLTIWECETKNEGQLQKKLCRFLERRGRGNKSKRMVDAE